MDGGKIRDGGGRGRGAYLTLHCHHLKCVFVCVLGGGILCTIGGRGGTTLSPPEVCVLGGVYFALCGGRGRGRYLKLHCHHQEGG